MMPMWPRGKFMWLFRVLTYTCARQKVRPAIFFVTKFRARDHFPFITVESLSGSVVANLVLPAAERAKRSSCDLK